MIDDGSGIEICSTEEASAGGFVGSWVQVRLKLDHQKGWWAKIYQVKSVNKSSWLMTISTPDWVSVACREDVLISDQAKFGRSKGGFADVEKAGGD